MPFSSPSSNRTSGFPAPGSHDAVLLKHSRGPIRFTANAGQDVATARTSFWPRGRGTDAGCARLLADHVGRLCLPARRSLAPIREVSQFPMLSFGTRRPHRPRRAGWLHLPAASPSAAVAWRPHWLGPASVSGCSAVRIAPARPRPAAWLTGHSKVNSFQFTRQHRFH